MNPIIYTRRKSRYWALVFTLEGSDRSILELERFYGSQPLPGIQLRITATTLHVKVWSLDVSVSVFRRMAL